MKALYEAYELASLMKEDPLYEEVLRLEKLMQEDEEAQNLSKRFKEIQEELENTSINKDGLLKELAQAKEELYLNEKVASYLKALRAWNALVEEIAEAIFGEFGYQRLC